MKKENGILSDVSAEDVELLKTHPKEFWKDVTTIGDKAFLSCSDLLEVEIPESVTSLGMSAFKGSGLKKVKINGGISTISYQAFADCLEL